MPKYIAHTVTIVCVLFFCTAHATTHTVHIGWTYDASQNPALSGFRLYQDDTSICHTTNPSLREMDCVFDSPYGTFNFYLAAYSSNAESPLSAPFPFTLKEPEPPTYPVAQVNATQISIDDTLVLELNPGSSEGDIAFYTWSFTDGSPDITNHGEPVKHVFPVNKVSCYTLTVTNVSGEQHSTNMSTITFLKQIHAIAIYHINSFLLNNNKKDE